MALKNKVGVVDDELLQREYEKDKEKGSKTDRGPVKAYFLKKGTTTIRVLPPVKGRKSWYREYFDHYLKTGEKGAYFNCPRTFNKECPICEKGKSLWQSEEEDKLEKVKPFRPRKQHIVNAIIMNDPNGTTPRAGVQLVKFGVKVKEQLLSLDRNFPHWGDMTNLEKGFDVEIDRRGDGLKTEYHVTGIPTRTNVEEVLSTFEVDTDSLVLNDLETALDCPLYEDLEAALNDDFVPGFSSQSPVVVEEDSSEEADSDDIEVVSNSGSNVPEPFTNEQGEN